MPLVLVLAYSTHTKFMAKESFVEVLEKIESKFEEERFPIRLASIMASVCKGIDDGLAGKLTLKVMEHLKKFDQQWMRVFSDQECTFFEDKLCGLQIFDSFPTVSKEKESSLKPIGTAIECPELESNFKEKQYPTPLISLGFEDKHSL